LLPHLPLFPEPRAFPLNLARDNEPQASGPLFIPVERTSSFCSVCFLQLGQYREVRLGNFIELLWN